MARLETRFPYPSPKGLAEFRHHENTGGKMRKPIDPSRLWSSIVLLAVIPLAAACRTEADLPLKILTVTAVDYRAAPGATAGTLDVTFSGGQLTASGSWTDYAMDKLIEWASLFGIPGHTLTYAFGDHFLSITVSPPLVSSDPGDAVLFIDTKTLIYEESSGAFGDYIDAKFLLAPSSQAITFR